MRHVIRCSAPDHDSRQGQSGWADALGTVELPDGQTPRPGHLCEACGVAQRATRKPRVPASTQLATLARAVHALVEGQPLADVDRQLLRDLVG